LKERYLTSRREKNEICPDSVTNMTSGARIIPVTTTTAAAFALAIRSADVAAGNSMLHHHRSQLKFAGADDGHGAGMFLLQTRRSIQLGAWRLAAGRSSVDK
jgi:hypothetical protein